jgi:hypothetical protein
MYPYRTAERHEKHNYTAEPLLLYSLSRNFALCSLVLISNIDYQPFAAPTQYLLAASGYNEI